MEFKVIIEINDPSECEEFAEQLRAFVHGEWWDQYPATVIGPYEPEGIE